MPENTEHPMQKPEKLIAKLILASSNEGDCIFDSLCRFGHFVRSCEKTKQGIYRRRNRPVLFVCITKKIEQYIHKHDTRLHGKGILESKHSALSKENIKRFAMVDSHNGAY